jgi:protease-4
MTFFKTVWYNACSLLLARIILFGGLLVVIVFGFIVFGNSEEEAIEIPDSYTLYINLNELPEKIDHNLKAKLLNESNSLTVFELTETLKFVKDDDDVKSVVINFGDNLLGIGNYQHLAIVLKDLSQHKKVITYSNNYSIQSLIASTGSNNVIMHPQGQVECKGLGVQLLYFKDILNRIGIEAEPIRAGKYKSAIEPFIKDSISPENEFQLKELLGSIWESLSNTIESKGNISSQEIDFIANNKGYLYANEAVEYGLIDSVGFLSDIINDEKLSNGDLLSSSNYFKKYKKKILASKDNNFAVLSLEGPIKCGDDEMDITATHVLKQIKEISKDKSIKGLVIRINSPGGSALASETIYQAVKKLNQSIPVVISMGDVAASGGYYIAMASDYVFAQPTTITGSIGVFGLMMNAEELTNKIGLNVSKVNTHQMSDFYSFDRSLYEYEKERIQIGIDSTYQTFLRRVSKGRGLTVNQVHSHAQGRIWSGVDAVKIGLVDSVGQLDDAIKYLKELIAMEDLGVKLFPKEKTLLQEISSNLDDSPQIQFPSTIQMIIDAGKDIEEIKTFNQPQARLPFKIKFQ